MQREIERLFFFFFTQMCNEVPAGEFRLNIRPQASCTVEFKTTVIMDTELNCVLVSKIKITDIRQFYQI